MLFTYQFSHASVTHILGNLYLLYIFGDNLEDRWGRARFVAMYLITGVVAGLVHAWHTADPGVPLIGASGAIAGLLGAYLVTFPRARVGMVLFFLPLRIRAFVYLFVYFVIQGLGMLLEWAFGFSYPISVSCHTTGFFVGLLFGLAWRKRDVRTHPG
jgi:membrane associated rhomboid family serine protease